MNPDERKCPHCAETIKREAVKCRFCSEQVEPVPIAPSAIDTTAKAANKGCLIGCGTILGALILLSIVGVIFQQIDWAAHPEHKVQYEKEQAETEKKRLSDEQAEKEQEAKKAADDTAAEKATEPIMPGDKGYIQAGTLIYPSLEAAVQGRKSMGVKDETGVSDLVKAEQMGMCDKRTHVLVIDSTSKDWHMFSQIRILDGKAAGGALWVSQDDVQHQ